MLKSIPVEVRKEILGKTAPPKNVYNFSVGQYGRNITLFWKLHKTNNILDDLDLAEIIIKRISGTVNITEEAFIKAEPYVVVSNSEEQKTIPIDFYGTFTYLIKTRDTSGNESTSVVGYTITTINLDLALVSNAYSENSPNTSFIVGITNTNYGEVNFPSFQQADQNGLVNSLSSNVDNANGSSSGWISSDFTSLELFDSSGTYITQIRDVGESNNYSVSLYVDGEQTIDLIYRDQWEEIHSGVADAQSLGNIEYGNWGSFSGTVVRHASVIDLDNITTDQIGEYPNGSNNTNYQYNGYYAVFTESNVQHQLSAGGGGSSTKSTSHRQRTRTNGVWGSWSAWEASNSAHILTNYNQNITRPYIIRIGATNGPTDIPDINPNAGYAKEDRWAIFYPATDKQHVVCSAWGTVERSRMTSAGFDDTILLDSSLTNNKGIGAVLEEANVRYDSNNRTLMSGNADGIVWAVRNPGQVTNANTNPSNDVANLHSYALIAGVINNNSIRLGNTYYANGVSTGGNSLANLVTSGASYQLVNIKQYNDVLNQTYEGSDRVVSIQKSIRTSNAYPYYTANGNVNESIMGSFSTYSAAEDRNFRYFQIKLDVTNDEPNNYSYDLTDFNYTVDRR